MILHGLNNTRYETGRELGRGGEGTVYDVAGSGSIVIKKYNEPLSPEKTDKLTHMVRMRGTELETYAAWPTDLVRDNTGICGFVMKKLSGYVPLHMIFSPMDRKKLFPDKGYNFLAHVARNLATAFHKLHEAGLVVGDVNEGNILISSSGMVAFIDCDSFQIRDQGSTFYCEVGIPRYTPPELLKLGSFDKVERTANTDSFSLAVLIFQLLFLGRHPFAGRNRTAADIDEETAIRQREFAYSLVNKKKKLSPPVDSFGISNLPDPVVSLFHRAFEQEERPSPAEWVVELDNLLRDMVTCDDSKLHSYPSGLKECPWCAFKKQKGILYFLDDSYLHANTVHGDIEHFVNGFRPEKLELKKWSGNFTYRALTAVPIDQKFHNYRLLRWGFVAGAMAIGILGVSLHIMNAFLLPVVFAIASAIYKYSPWTTLLKNELQRRQDAHKTLKQKLDSMIAEHDRPADMMAYMTGVGTLERLVHDFRRLPEQFEYLKKQMEERIYNEQLDRFLAAYLIDDHTIPGFGAAKKLALSQYGIRNAADLSRLGMIKIPGIGPRNQQVLYDWRRQMAAGFAYIPDANTIAAGLQTVNADFAKTKAQLEAAIRKEYRSLSHLKLNITNRGAVLERQINDVSLKTYQAKLDADAFKKIAA